jgi:protein-tyrosine phosphatase
MTLSPFVRNITFSILCLFPVLTYATPEPQTDKALIVAEPANSRLLELEGSSNFRDLGGYETLDNKTVRQGLLFRSGAMANLTASDQEYLNNKGFKTVMDLRSREEIELLPNHWARNSEITYLFHDYSIADLIPANKAQREAYHPGNSYRAMPARLKPQLRLYFQSLLEENVPMVVNCHAGQDRTGVASAMLLSALGVPRDVIIQDYLASTAYRRPEIEFGGVDLQQAAKTNVFAKMMLGYQEKMAEGPKPLMTDDKTPYLLFAFDEIEKQYGSVLGFLDREIGVSAEDVVRLKALYLE